MEGVRMKDFVAEVNANPLPRDVFGALVDIIIEALSGRRRTIPPDAERCLEDAPPGSIILTDCPENQMGMSIIEECNERFPAEIAELIAQSVFFRWFAVGKARRDGQIDEFILRSNDNTQEIHEAVFCAAAECPINGEGEFDDSFVGRIREIIASGE